MLQLSLIAFVLWGGTLVEPFRIAEAEPDHHQVCMRAAMAPDGHFAIAWVDSLPLARFWQYELDLYIRFFDSTGNPMTEAYKITKMVDTNWIYHPCLEMDTAGNVVLLWAEAAHDLELEEYIRFQRFAPEGSPVGSAHTLVPQVWLHGWRPIGLSLANSDEFAIAWNAPSTLGGYGAWVQRFNREGYPKDKAFLAHDDFDTSVSCHYPQVALNDAGDLVVTWYEFGPPSYPRFQVFDAEDESILPWEPMGYRLDDGEERYAATRAEPFWLDEDRFVVFWIDKTSRAGILPHLVGRVFSDQGLTRHPIRSLVHDSLTGTWVDPRGRFAVALSSDERFAETHTRSHYDYPDTSNPWKQRNWEHGAGMLGYIQNSEPIRRTTLFEYTPPLGEDTINSIIDNWPHIQFPAVACCDDRIVWVYSRLNTDTIFEAFVMITDWDMGVGVVEQPIVEKPPNWEVITSIGPQIVLRYYDRPDGFRASIFDASGRKVDELKSPAQNGTLTWGENHILGVYFIVPQDSQAPALKVVLVR